ncbi:hypothetical protein VE04_01499 [Pseudogymnoascus sp. 24MN13]|nr:hypothetical protein VE04_01499 [Pseudogymnoascus sp. 24MN13]
MEDPQTSATPAPPSCFNCKKLQTEFPKLLMRCAKCLTALYCSLECFQAMNDMFGLSNDDFLHDRPEGEVFNLLIDSFRMRVEDESVYGGNTIGVYNGENILPLFKKFLSLAESRQKLLPTWWSSVERGECERLAESGSQWSDINCAVEKSEIQDHYNDNLMPMKMRILAEKIYGKGFM